MRGFVLAEGAAVVVIERLSHAEARGANAARDPAGYGTSADAYHLTAGEPTGAGAQVSMRNAMRMPDLSPGEIDYINAHSDLDRGRRCGRDSPASAPCSPIAARSLADLLDQVGDRPPDGRGRRHRGGVFGDGHPRGRSCRPPEPRGSRAVGRALRPRAQGGEAEDAASHVLSNSFGFGGVNASLVFSAM